MTICRLALVAPICVSIAIHSASALAGHGEASPKEVAGDGDPNKERRDWMNKGNAEYVQKHWEAALDDYLKAWAIKHHYTIAANIADVQIRMGHYAEAVGYLKYVLANIAEEQGDKRKLAEEQLAECRNHLTAVRVAVDVTDATILVDGRDVGQTPLREDLLLEPGKHVISVTKPGYGNESKELSAQGSHVEVTLTLAKANSVQITAAAPLPASETPKSHETSTLRLGSYVGFGVGAVGVALGTYFLVKGYGNSSDADKAYQACSPGCSTAQQQPIDDLDTQAVHQKNTGVVSLLVGGVGLATGVTLLILEPKKATPSNTAFVRPWLGAGQAGLLGRF